ncbi:anti-sigma factor family protein [Bacillus sp. Marseille-P3661]|uniref:anti-sigma factor family protein n=1 Tax=Bacillus sp. Marseille-P3661 TaxID=1936234 RepID=UPI000C822E57|nr:anti-sigma factor [Bacillus sp. Marseille-P3661]
MECSTEIVELMHKYLDEETSEEENKALKGHIESCTTCQQYFQQLKKAIAYVQSTTHIKAPEHFTANVMSRLPKEKPSLRYTRWFKAHPTVSAAAAFVILMMGSVFANWENDQLSVSKQSNLQIQEQTVIVPEGVVVEGDVVVRNGDIKIEGEVDGNVTVINGDKYLASAGRVTGEIEEIDAIFEWIWYNMKKVFTAAF